MRRESTPGSVRLSATIRCVTSSQQPRHALDDNSSGGLPIRGLAMILLAVAVLLIGWAVFSLAGNGENGGDNAAGGSSSQTTSDSPGAGESTQSANAGTAVNNEASEPSKDNGAGEATDVREKPSSDPGDADVDRSQVSVTVLNNSPVSGLASTTAERLEKADWNRPNVGNLPDDARVFESSVVLYPANDAASHAAAEEIARDLNIRAMARNSRIDDALHGADLQENGEVAKVVVVTTSDMQHSR